MSKKILLSLILLSTTLLASCSETPPEQKTITELDSALVTCNAFKFEDGRISCLKFVGKTYAKTGAKATCLATKDDNGKFRCFTPLDSAI